MKATKELIISIILSNFQDCEFYPYQIQNILFGMGCGVSESTLTRQFRRWVEIIAIPPRNPKMSRAWTYKLVFK